jgi:inhibitor of KinA
MQKLTYLCQGEAGLVVELADKIDPEINSLVHALSRRINLDLADCVDAIVPTYRSLLIVFDPLQIPRNQLIDKIEKSFQSITSETRVDQAGKIVVIPVLYGGESGPDLEFVARHNKLSVEEVVSIHTSVSYRIYMMGFTPGFPYLGGMSERIAAPRLATPRKEIPAGSVGIAGVQTGLYPQVSPGGWQLIGRTPLKVFNPQNTEPFLYQAGDFLRFETVSATEFTRIERAVERGEYTPQTRGIAEVSS